MAYLASDASVDPDVTKLNDDVLRVIFALAEVVSPIQYLRDHGRYDLGWVKLTHICRRWRTVLLHMGELWARNVCSIPFLFNIFFSRSGNWPLSFAILPYEATGIIQLLQHIERVGELRWTTGTAEQIAFALDGKYMPRLRVLDLRGISRLDRERSLIRLHVPSLEDACIIGADAALYGTNMRSLFLRSPPQSPTLLLDMLSASSRLEHLTVFLDIPTARQWDIFEGDKIQLPKLRKFSLTSNTRDGGLTIPFLLRRLCLPEDVCIELSMSIVIAVDSIVVPIANALLPYLHFHGYNTVDIRRAEDITTPFVFILHGSDKTVAERPRGIRVQFLRHQGDAGQHTVADSWTTPLSHFLRRIPVERITQLMLLSLPDSEISSPALSVELRRFTRTKRVYVDTGIACALVTGLLVPDKTIFDPEIYSPSSVPSPLPSETSTPSISAPRLPFPTLEALYVQLTPRALSDVAVAAVWWHALNGALERRPARLAGLIILPPPAPNIGGRFEEDSLMVLPRDSRSEELAFEAHRRGIARALLLVQEASTEDPGP
jgi:uncharacterized membrane protein